jgi:hypothetical protein
MVWIIHGNLNSSLDGKELYLLSPLHSTPYSVVLHLPPLTLHLTSDATDSQPAASCHYLHPGRAYRSGRLGGWSDRPDGKQPTRPKPHDFKIKSLSVSKDGSWELHAAGQHWQPVSYIITAPSCYSPLLPRQPSTASTVTPASPCPERSLISLSSLLYSPLYTTSQQLDDPTSPTNLDPYPLTLKLNHSNAVLHRNDENEGPECPGQPMPSGEYQIQHGDRFVYGKFKSEVR